ncbi:MAG: hypothetical protein LBC20_04420 [Planctomycetaceae bacterium]|jgi:hypothetical protein|nr:hypothetical protein [Planctomycetaceae bacterium]
MTLNKIFKFQCLLFFLMVFTFMGCSGTSWRKPDLSVLKPAGPPAQAVAVWEPAVKHETGLEPQRGFGGRVYFYDQESKKPIKINGNIVVYAFDEENRKPDDNAPTRSYLFDKDDIKKLYSKSKLGPSYNFWIPWDSEGADGKTKKVSLIVRYIPEVGSSVVSSQAAVYLPGKLEQTEFMAKNNWENRKIQGDTQEGIIQQVAHWSPNDPKTSANNTDSKHSQPVEHLVESNNNRTPTMKISTIR